MRNGDSTAWLLANNNRMTLCKHSRKGVLSVPTRVTDLMVRAIGSRSILVTWAPPLHSNGVLRGYFLTFSSDTSQFTYTYIAEGKREEGRESRESRKGTDK